MPETTPLSDARLAEVGREARHVLAGGWSFAVLRAADVLALASEVAGLRAELDAARAVLRDVEWASEDIYQARYCPKCGRGHPEDFVGEFAGHAPGCALAALLAHESPPEAPR